MMFISIMYRRTVNCKRDNIMRTALKNSSFVGVATQSA